MYCVFQIFRIILIPYKRQEQAPSLRQKAETKIIRFCLLKLLSFSVYVIYFGIFLFHFYKTVICRTESDFFAVSKTAFPFAVWGAVVEMVVMINKIGAFHIIGKLSVR